MKLHDLFRTFLEDHVNLNDTRLNLLEGSIVAVQNAVRALAWGPKIVSFAPQGSWAHETIIKPQAGQPFDADLLVFVEAKEGWTPKDYVNGLATELGKLPAYEGKVRRFSHCATIEYAGERKIDIAPCVMNRLYAGQYEVCNRGTDQFELSAPLEYTDWVKGQNGTAGGNDLKKVTRLLKYMRDIKGNFTCPSFLLTTLMGMQVYDSDRGSAQFADLTTTLKTLVGRLDNWLQARPNVPIVPNPKLPREDQASGWGQVQYSNFRDKVNLYRGWIDDAYAEEDRDESIGKWQRVFGEYFGAGEAKRAAEAVSESAADGASVVGGHFRDLVEKVKALGAAAVPMTLRRLPHVRRPVWRKGADQYTVKVTAELQTAKHGNVLRLIRSADPLQAGNWVRFTAANTMGIPFSDDYKVEWRVTNTDKVAARAGVLRGDFYPSDDRSSRAEQLSYRGVHFVEAFLVRKRDNRLVGQSEPFYVVIE
ncbi:cyclic GMP-AMP synthase DncV-like nucleotidyltransferase [Cupriavidus sp. amp6]|uniref:SMODS domain-containing nucleotidyltransferase n=1 Tax=Cupriavidus sp. amp6 TaxID=388051 RepID=UPI0004083144|nr:nucleotidyltransferase [Cupriavidus sp. amp6]